jgi:multiple sugar transport system permease protein
VTTLSETRTADAPTARYVAGHTGGRGRIVRRVLFWATLILLALIFVAPLIWMLITSFKTPDAATSSYKWWPNPFDTSSYDQLLHSSSLPVLRWFVNSLLAGLANAALIVVVDSMAAYALARMEFFAKRPIFAIVIATIFLPVFVFLVPNFLIVSKLGWLDSLWAIIVPSAGGAFGVFFLRQFFLGLPMELEEAARIDGAGELRVFARVMVPLVKPAIATVVVFRFVPLWNDFFFPLVLLRTTDRYTLPVGLTQFFGEFQTNWSALFAGLVIATVPLIVLFLIATRQIVQGLTAGMGR